MAYIGNAPADRFTSIPTVQQFNGDGSTTAFTLSRPVGTDQDLLVSVDGVIQDTAAYAVSNGTTLTFSAAPSTGTANIFVNYLGVTIGSVVHPASSSISAAGASLDGAVTINDSSADVDFRVESNGNANMLFVDGGNDRVGVNTGSPAATFTVKGTANTYAGGFRLEGTDETSAFAIAHVNGDNYFSGNATDDHLVLTGSGNLLVSTSSDFASGTVDGILAQGTNKPAAGFSNTEDGQIVKFYQTGSLVGNIGTISTDIYIGTGDTGLRFLDSSNAILPARGDTGATRDDAIDFGTGSARFDDIYATNGTIQTSDQTEKQDIAALTSTEMLVGKRISALFKTFRWKDKVASKGDNARTHTGIIAQDVQAAFTAEGLDAGDYSLFISSTWLVDSEGNEVEEGTEGAVSKTRMGIRYPELLSFVAAYNEQRFANIEARITALE